MTKKKETTTPLPPAEHLITLAQAARMLACERSTLWRRVKAGELNGWRWGISQLIHVDRRDILPLSTPSPYVPSEETEATNG